MPDEDLYLVQKLKNDDEAAYKVIFNTYYPRLFYFILEFVPQHDIAENIIQDTFLSLWNKRKDLNTNTVLSAYLFTVAKNICLYKLRDKKYRQKLFSANSINDDLLGVNLNALDTLDTSTVVFQEIEKIIERTLEELPPQCRKVFTLSRFEEKKNREIAEELDISIKAVEGHISKGLKKFRLALKDYLPFVIYLFINQGAGN